MRKRAMRERGVRVHHKTKSDGVRVDHEKRAAVRAIRSDGMRVHHEKEQ